MLGHLTQSESLMQFKREQISRFRTALRSCPKETQGALQKKQTPIRVLFLIPRTVYWISKEVHLETISDLTFRPVFGLFWPNFRFKNWEQYQLSYIAPNF